MLKWKSEESFKIRARILNLVFGTSGVYGLLLILVNGAVQCVDLNFPRALGFEI